MLAVIAPVTSTTTSVVVPPVKAGVHASCTAEPSAEPSRCSGVDGGTAAPTCTSTSFEAALSPAAVIVRARR